VKLLLSFLNVKQYNSENKTVTSKCLITFLFQNNIVKYLSLDMKGVGGEGMEGRRWKGRVMYERGLGRLGNRGILVTIRKRQFSY